MITHATPTGWQIIYQRAHALLAAQIVQHWRVDQRPTRWLETLAAVLQHDDGGHEWGGTNLLTLAGAPNDFKLGAPSLHQPGNLIKSAREQGQYIALLHSMHVTTLYKDFDQPDLVAFLEEQQLHQRAWRKALGMTKAEADAAYRLLYWCDSFSLILCQRQLPTDGREIEIAQGVDGTVYHARRKPETGGSDPRAGDESTLLVEPWCFEEDAFTVSIEATEIDGMVFASDAALMKAIQKGRIVPLTWIFEKS
ncbi:MAG: DUF3891 family protein [Chloroflexota bacterium]|nr:DUF3891 family protein [Chloroflexota bacterium]